MCLKFFRKSLVLVSLLVFTLSGCSSKTPTVPNSAATPAEVLDIFAQPKASKEEVKSSEWVSFEIVVDDIYKSMMGPGRQDYININGQISELAWLTGFEVEVMKADGETPLGQQYLCHSNLDVADVSQHYMMVTNELFNPGRYFTISQGQQEAKLPPGMGIPVNTKHPLNWNGQALNLNEKPETPVITRQRVQLKYILDKDASTPIKPLFVSSLVGLKTVGDNPAKYTMSSHEPANLEGGSCLVGSSAVVDGVFTDKQGNQFTAHWIVEPGVENNVTALDDILTLPYDTKIHYAMVHVHAFCTSVELYDLTAKKSVLKFDCTQFPDKIGLLKTQEFSSMEGLDLYKDHHYELRSRYDNTSGTEQDAMVVLYLYMEDKSFDKSKLKL